MTIQIKATLTLYLLTSAAFASIESDHAQLEAKLIQLTKAPIYKECFKLSEKVMMPLGINENSRFDFCISFAEDNDNSYAQAMQHLYGDPLPQRKIEE